MLLDSLQVDAASFESRTGWKLEPRGACRGDVCVPLPPGAVDKGILDVPVLAEALRMPLLEDRPNGRWALGPESGGRALTTAVAPEVVLSDLDGNPFALSSLRGQKVLLVAWASW